MKHKYSFWDFIKITFNSVTKYAVFFKNFNWVLNEGKGNLKTALYAPQKHVYSLQGTYCDCKCVSCSYTHTGKWIDIIDSNNHAIDAICRHGIENNPEKVTLASSISLPSMPFTPPVRAQ